MELTMVGKNLHKSLVCIIIIVFIFLHTEIIECVIYEEEWSKGRSTYYTTFNDGNCGYGQISALSFPYRHIAAPNQHFYNNGAVCGQCYQIQCINDWNKMNEKCCNENTEPITVQIVDQCPIETNEEYCSGDETHFDLSYFAFQAIADPICGVIEMQYRRVSCDFNNNIIIRNKDGINNWWYAIYIEQIAGYGDLTKVEMRDSSGDGVWHIGKTGENGNHFYVFEKKLLNGFVLPFDIRITNGNDQTLTAWHKVTSVESNKTFDFGSNFPLDNENKVNTVVAGLGDKRALLSIHVVPIRPEPLALSLSVLILLLAWAKICKINLSCMKISSLTSMCSVYRILRILKLLEHNNEHNDGHNSPINSLQEIDINVDKLPPLVVLHDTKNIPLLRTTSPDYNNYRSKHNDLL